MNLIPPDHEAAKGNAAHFGIGITAATGDKINQGTAGKSYKCVTDTAGQSVTITAIDDTNWEVVAEKGTWANDNN